MSVIQVTGSDDRVESAAPVLCHLEDFPMKIVKLGFACALATILGGSLTTVFSQAPDPQAPNPDRLYHIGPDSMAQDGVPKGEIRGPFTLPSQVFPGTQHTYWVYVPAQYRS